MRARTNIWATLPCLIKRENGFSSVMGSRQRSADQSVTEWGRGSKVRPAMVLGAGGFVEGAAEMSGWPVVDRRGARGVTVPEARATGPPRRQGSASSEDALAGHGSLRKTAA